MFIWNSPMELIKRKTLCLDYEEGGLKMICIRTKIKTILLKNFLDIILNKERMFYQLSVKWLKFKLRGYDLRNFNIIPSNTEGIKPLYYKQLSLIVDEYKKIEIINKEQIKKISSKKIYTNFLKSNTVKPVIESKDKRADWKKIYVNLHDKCSFNNDIKTFLYKFLFDVLPCNQKFNKNKNTCYLCKKTVETTEHLFFKCEKTSLFYKEISNTLEDVGLRISKESFWFNYTISNSDYRVISIFYYTIWQFRNNIRINSNSQGENNFKYRFKYNITYL